MPARLVLTTLAALAGCAPVPHGAAPDPVVAPGDEGDTGGGGEADTAVPSPDDPDRPRPDNGEAYDGSGGGNGGDDEACEDEPAVEGDPLADLGRCGRLVYGPYRARGDAEAHHRLPDFSWAGYEQGGVALPEVAVAETVSPGSGDDTDRIQASLDAVSAREPGADGFRGAVVLEAGRYQLDHALEITASGVVLRGAGQGEDGTVLVATATERMNLIEVLGARGPQERAERLAVTDPIVPVGATVVQVDDASALSVGEPVALLRTPNRAWIEDLGMDAWGWSAGSYEVAHERTVMAIDGDRVTLDIPVVDALLAEHGGGALVAVDAGARVHHVGIEDLRLDSTYRHDEDDHHGWNGVWLEHAEHAWVRRVTVAHVGRSAVAVDGSSRFITVEDTALLDPVSPITGGRRYPFAVEGGLGVLFQRCYARGGRHNFVAGSRVTGPNVWLDCLAEDSHSDDGPHHRWATGLLFDNTRSRQLRVQNRADSGSGHGWAGAQVMFWNGEVTREFVSDAPLAAMNWVVGVVGSEGDGQWVPAEPPGHQESLGVPVLPRSLYLQQLADRLGDDAVEAVTTAAQREGRVWADLRDWGGEGPPDPGSDR